MWGRNLAFCIVSPHPWQKFRDCEYWCTEDVELEIGCYNCRLTCSVSLDCCYSNQLMILKDFHRHPRVKIALARHQGLPFLTAGLPSFVTRKDRDRITLIKSIEEMMTFLRKSKFSMINIAIIMTIIYQNRFLL